MLERELQLFQNEKVHATNGYNAVLIVVGRSHIQCWRAESINVQLNSGLENIRCGR